MEKGERKEKNSQWACLCLLSGETPLRHHWAPKPRIHPNGGIRCGSTLGVTIYHEMEDQQWPQTLATSVFTPFPFPSWLPVSWVSVVCWMREVEIAFRSSWTSSMSKEWIILRIVVLRNLSWYHFSSSKWHITGSLILRHLHDMKIAIQEKRSFPVSIDGLIATIVIRRRLKQIVSLQIRSSFKNSLCSAFTRCPVKSIEKNIGFPYIKSGPGKQPKSVRKVCRMRR